jgi:sarcosine oxidase subunit gamma
MTTPDDFLFRSHAYRKLLKHDAHFEAMVNAAVARHYGDPVGEAETARRLGLADLSPLPRLGVKGPGTADWLAGQGIQVPAESNQAVRQSSGVLAARLAPAELMLLGDLSGDPAPLDAIAAAWRAEPQSPVPPERPRGFLLPRQHSHFWFVLSGDCTAGMFAKLCGVDLRPGKFANGRIAQTSIARMNAVVIRDDQGGVLAYHLLGDSASAEYLWDCLNDAMAEFDGAPVGLAALRGLADVAGGDVAAG